MQVPSRQPNSSRTGKEISPTSKLCVIRSMRYTKEILEPIVATSKNVTDVLKKLGKRTDGATHSYLSNRIKILKISTEHFVSGPHNKGQLSPHKLSAQEYAKSSCVKSHKLKLKLIDDGIKEAKCESCGLSKWMSKSIPLELDHIDGNHFNNDFNNLRILCPNCHAQTPTYSGKNSNGGVAQ